MNARSFASLAALAWLLAASPRAASAEFIASAALVSDYDYRGVTQSADGPAFQPVIDYVGGDLHLQAWSSNVTFDTERGTERRCFGRNHTEVSLTADYKFDMRQGVQIDAGASFFDYPGGIRARTSANYS